MSNKIKEKFYYKLIYDIKLNKGKLFKANNEFKSLKEKFINYQESILDDREEILDKIARKIERKSKEISELNEEKSELQQKFNEFENGEMDEELELENNDRIEGKKERKIQRDLKREKTNNENKGLSQVYYNRTITTSRKDRYLKKNILSDYNYYVKTSLTLPEVYKKKLKEMTNNNAYLWKRIYFYGDLPTKEDDNSRTIYKLFCDKIIIYYKDNKGNRTETVKYKRKKNNNTNTYIKYNKNHNFKFKNI